MHFLLVLCTILAVEAVTVNIEFDITVEDGGEYGNFPGARKEYHCIVDDEIQGMYGMIGVFWGTFENYTAAVNFVDNDGSTGEAWLTYAADWTWVNGTWKFDGNDTIYTWDSVNGTMGEFDSVRYCLWANGTNAAGKWMSDEGGSYVCISGGHVTGSYKFVEEGELEYGVMEGTTFQGDAHYTDIWTAKTGAYAGESGPELYKTTILGDETWIIGYYCTLSSPGVFEGCFYYPSKLEERDDFTAECQQYPEPLAALPISVSLTITDEDGGLYGNFTGSRSEYHCIDENYNIQGMYGKYGVFWGTIFGNMTAQVTFVDYARGEADLVYADDWSSVTGMYTIEGEAGEFEWDARNGVTGNADWQTDCLVTSHVPGSLNGLWKGDTLESYYCVDQSTTIAGSFKYVPGTLLDYGVYANGTVFGPDNKNAEMWWTATSGPDAGVTGFKIVKGEFQSNPPKVLAYLCVQGSEQYIWSNCYYDSGDRIESGLFPDECAEFPRDMTGTTEDSEGTATDDTSQGSSKSEGTATDDTSQGSSKSEDESSAGKISVVFVWVVASLIMGW